MRSPDPALTRRELEDSHAQSTAMFCSVIVWMANIAFVLMRKGFPVDFLSLFILNGISLFLLFAPSLIQSFFPVTRYYPLYFGNMSLRAYGLIFFALIGLIFGDVAQYFGIGIAATGFICHFYFIIRAARTWNLQKFYILTISLFLAAWAVVKVWGVFSLHPLFTEALATLTEQDLPYLHDTLYHASIAQMIKSYGIPSTGLDGLPFMYYHFGSHWLMGHFSSFTGLDVITMYNAGYPIIFVPLFFFTFIQLAVELQLFFLQRLVVNGFFWLAILCFFIPLPGGLYSQGLLGLSLLANESQTISMIFLFFLFSICLNLPTDFRRNKIAYSLLIPLTVVFIAFLKISTAFVVMPFLFYLFIRYQGYKQGWATVGMMTCIIGFIFAYFYTVETVPFLRTKSYEGTFSFFHFYKETHTFKPVDWFLWFYFWAYAAIALVSLFANRIALNQPSHRWLGVEAVIITALVGVMPSVFMSFSGGNSMYFSNIQLYVSVLVCLGLFPLIADSLKNIFSKLSRPIFLFSKIAIIALVFIFAWREIRSGLRFMLKKSVQVRLSSAGIDYSHLPYRMKLSGPDIKEAYAVEAGDLIRSRPSYQYLTGLLRLNNIPLPVKNSTVLFKQCVCPDDIEWNFNCVARAHILPAFTGFASIRGIPGSCGIGVYGETYYSGQYAEPDRILSAREAHERAERDGFKNILFYNCITKEFSDEISSCLPIQP